MITKKQLDTIERFADKLWSKVGLDIEFTRHFLDRLNDARNKKNITQAELTRLFKQSFKKYGNKISNLGADAQAVIKDMQTDINMPFVLQIDKNGELDLVAKTIMRKKDFKTTNQKFTVESGAGDYGTNELSYKYKKDTPGQTINGKTMKREKFIPKTVIDEDVPAFMGALAQAAKDGKKEFKLGDKTYKVKLKKDVVDKITKNMKESEDIDDIISALTEASASDYAKLSDDDLLDLLGIFKNVGRSAAKPVLKALQMELKKRNLKEGLDARTKEFKEKLKKLEYAKGKEEEEIEEADGWIAIFKGKKLEITKKDAKDLWGAKQFAINKLKVPKSKQGLLAIKPAYNESTDLEEASDKDLDIKSIKALIKKPSPEMIKQYGGKDKYIKMLKSKLAKLESTELVEYNNRLKAHTPAAAKRLIKKLKNKFSGYKWDGRIKGDEIIYPLEPHIVRFIKKQPEVADMNEEVSLEEAKAPFATLEKDWLRIKGVDTPRANKTRERLIKKYNLKPLISAVRPGSIKLGPLNDLKAKMGNHTIAGLDADGELIFITNNPVKIYYPSNTKKRPEGEEMMSESVSLETLRLRKVVELSLGESVENVDSFIAEANIELTMTPSAIQKAYKKYVIERKGVPTYEIYHKSYSDAMQSAKSFAKGSGYEVDEDDWYNQVTTGPRKPSKDKVNRFSILLIKNGKEQKKRLQIQVTNLASGGRPFELNAYIA